MVKLLLVRFMNEVLSGEPNVRPFGTMAKTYGAAHYGIKAPRFNLCLKIISQRFTTSKCTGWLTREWSKISANDYVVGQDWSPSINESKLEHLVSWVDRSDV